MKFPEVLDSSILADFKACPALCKLSHFEEWKPKSRSTHLHAGGAFARGAEVARRAFYQGLLPSRVEEGKWVEMSGLKDDPELAVISGVEDLIRFYGDHQPPAFGTAANKTSLRMAGALEFYFERYPLNRRAAFPIVMPNGKLGIEYNFVHPLPILNPDTGMPLQYSGRADGIFDYAGGVYIFDDKTASSLGPTWSKQWKLRAQFSGYCWAARESGLKVDGVVVRGVSILKEKYDTQENISFRSDYLIKSWYDELLDWIDRMIHCYKTNTWSHNYDHSCSDFGGCAFQEICDMEEQQPWLERGHERRHWDPVTRTETKLEE